MKKRLICVLVSFCLLLIALTIRISRNYAVSCDVFAEIGIKGSITKDINSTILEKLNIEENTFDFKTINYKTDGSISQIEINTAKINLFCNETSEDIFQLICHRTDSYGIPIGNTMGYAPLSGKGPKLKVNILPIGNVEYEINSELLSSGINQTLHRISADFTVEIQCLAPFHQYKTEITVPMIISEILIMGTVPEVLFSS